MSTEAQKRASTNYNRKQDNIMIRPNKEEGTAIRAAAVAAGQSVQAYILQAVRERMGRERSAEATRDALQPLQGGGMSGIGMYGQGVQEGVRGLPEGPGGGTASPGVISISADQAGDTSLPSCPISHTQDFSDISEIELDPEDDIYPF